MKKGFEERGEARQFEKGKATNLEQTGREITTGALLSMDQLVGKGGLDGEGIYK